MSPIPLIPLVFGLRINKIQIYIDLSEHKPRFRVILKEKNSGVAAPEFRVSSFLFFS